nr:glutaminase [Paenibacillus timonensis]
MNEWDQLKQSISKVFTLILALMDHGEAAVRFELR